MITHQVKNWTILILFILLLVSGFLNILQVRNAKQEQINRMAQNLVMRDSITLNRDRYERATAQVETLTAQIIKSTSENKKVLEVKEKAIATLSGKLAEKRAPVQVMIDTTELLKDFVDTYDSVDQAKDELISEMKLRHAAEIVDMNALVEAQAKQVMAAVSTAEAWRVTAENAQKDASKANTAKKVWRFIAGVGVAAVGILLLKPN